MVGMPSPADGPGVDVEVRDQVLHLRLNRPERKNALDATAVRTMVEALEGASTDDSLRAVGVSGRVGSGRVGSGRGPDRTSALAPRLYGRGRCETNSGSTREGDVPGGRFERTDGMTSTSQTARHHASTCAELAILKGCSRFGSPMI